MACDPTGRLAAVQVAATPEPTAAAQSTVPSAVNETVPVGVAEAAPDAATMADSVTAWPKTDGSGALPTVVEEAPRSTTWLQVELEASKLASAE